MTGLFRSTSMPRMRKGSGRRVRPAGGGCTTRWRRWIRGCGGTGARCRSLSRASAHRPGAGARWGRCARPSRPRARRLFTSIFSTTRRFASGMPRCARRSRRMASMWPRSTRTFGAIRGRSPRRRMSHTGCLPRSGATCARGSMRRDRWRSPRRCAWRRWRRRPRWTISRFCRRWTGLKGSTSGRRARRARTTCSACLPMTRWATTPVGATCRRGTVPHGSPRTCISVRSRRARSPSACARISHGARTRPTWNRTCASLAGANSATTCYGTSPIRRKRTSTRSSMRSAGRSVTPMRCAAGSRARPAFRSSMPACVSSGQRAGCITAYACWLPAC